MMRIIDAISDWLGILAAWLFFTTGVFLTFEVGSRYLFNAPTVWVEEVSQLLLIAGVYLAVSRTIHRRQNIRIDALYGQLSPGLKKLADVFALISIIVFSCFIIWYGTAIAWDSFVVGRSTGSILNIPNWWSEGLVPFGFLLVALQALAELYRVLSGHDWGDGKADDHTDNDLKATLGDGA